MLESVSALVDNDWDDESHFNEVLGQIQHPAAGQAQLRRKFERYSLIRDAMHKDLGNSVPTDFASRVSAAIANEPTIVTPVAASAHSRSSAQPHIDLNASTDYSIQQHSSAVGSDVASEVGSEQARKPVSLTEHRAKRDSKQTSLNNNDGVFWSRFGVGVGGFAVAASAAMVALVGFNVLDQSGGAVGPAAGGSQVAAIDVQNSTNAVAPASGLTPTVKVIDQEQFQNTTAQAGFSTNDAGNLEGRAVVNSFNNASIEYVSNSTTFWVRDDNHRNPEMENRLNRFLSQHMENSPTARMGGILPYARIVGYDAQPMPEESTNPAVVVPESQ